MDLEKTLARRMLFYARRGALSSSFVGLHRRRRVLFLRRIFGPFRQALASTRQPDRAGMAFLSNGTTILSNGTAFLCSDSPKMGTFVAAVYDRRTFVGERSEAVAFPTASAHGSVRRS
jgi:hypothetical protein